MTLAVLDHVSLPGDPTKPNEDFLAYDSQAALVMDGATPLGESLMPGPSDAAWIAQFGSRRLLAHLREGAGPRQALQAALFDAQTSFQALRRSPPEQTWQTPCASMMLAVEHVQTIEFLWYGDCAALVKQHDQAVAVIGESFAKRAQEAERARALARQKNLSPALGLSRPEFIASLRHARNQLNSGDYWLFSPDIQAASHVGHCTMPVERGGVLLLASDGFLALASDYGALTIDSLMAQALSTGLSGLAELLRNIEANDSGGDMFARFKKSDDATALLLEVR